MVKFLYFEFLNSAKISKRSVLEFVEILSNKPFKLKQGFIDFWIPTFLFIKRDEYALFNEGIYTPVINEDILERISKVPEDFEGKKKFEFRKIIFKNPNVKTVVVYASSPVQQVIGEFEIDDILSCAPDEIWRLTKKYSGISEQFFYDYFADREIAHAIKIKDATKYDKPLSLKENYKVSPPQSYLYLEEQF